MFRRGSLNVVIAVLLGVVLMMGGGLVYLSNREPTMTTETDTIPVSQSQEDLERLATDPVVPEGTTLVVEYTEGMTLTPADQDQIASRVAAPIREYYGQMSEEKSVIKLLVSSESATTYNIGVFHADQTTNDFVITKFEEGFDWWQPLCGEACVFSPSFAQKYPQIVERARN